MGARVGSGMGDLLESATITLTISLASPVGTTTDCSVEGNAVGERVVTLGDLVADRLAAQLGQSYGSAYVATVAQLAEAAAEKLVEERFRAVLAREIIPTDSYGTPKGAGRTIAEVLEAKVEAWLNAKHGDSYNQNRPTNLQKLIDDAIGRQFAGEVGKTVATAKIDALDAVADQVTAGVAAVLRKAVR